MENTLDIFEVNESNKAETKMLVAEYGRYLYYELKLMAGREAFVKELETFPDKKYNRPDGAFYIVCFENIPIGCLGFKRWSTDQCELKRMYLRAPFRGRGFSYRMVRFILQEAKKFGYKKMLLDTNIEMEAAHKVYLKVGFEIIPPYCENDNAHPIYMAYDLTSVDNVFEK